MAARESSVAQSRDVKGLARVIAAFFVAMLAQSEIYAGRSANGLALYLVAVVFYLRSGPRVALREGLLTRRHLSGDTQTTVILLLACAPALALFSYRLFNLGNGAFTPWVFYLAALACLVAAALTLRRYEEGEARKPLPIEWLLLTLIMIWAAFMRLYRLDVLPSGIYYDEAVNAMEGINALANQHFPAYFPGELGYYGRFGALYEYFTGLVISLGGANELALRLTAVFPGLLTVALFYRLSRQMFSAPVALLATLFLASSRWHVNFSRIAFDAIMVPALLVPTMSFLLQGLRGRLSGYLLSGVFLGLGLMTYTAFRTVPILVLVTIAVFVALRAAPWRGIAIGMVLLALAATVAAIPEIFHLRDDRENFWERTKTVSILKGRSIWEAKDDIVDSARLHLAMFNFAGDRNGRHNLPGRPMLEQPVAMLFVLGLAACLACLRQPECPVILAWLAMGLASAIMSNPFEAPQSLRSIAAIPAVYLIAAIPLADVWQRWRESFGARRWGILLPPLVLGVVWFLAGSYQVFFTRQAGDFAVWNAFSTPETLMAREIKRLGPGWDVRIDPILHGQPVLRFLAPEFDEPEPFDPSGLLPLENTGDNGTVIFLGQQYAPLTQLLPLWYPSAQGLRYTNKPGGRVSLYEYILTPEDVRSVQGLQLVTSYTGAPIGPVPVPDLHWQRDNSAAELPSALTWTGVLTVPHSGIYRLQLQGGGEGSLILNDKVVIVLPGNREAKLRLAQGRYSLWAQVIPEASDSSIALLWQPPGAGSSTLVSSEYFYRYPVSNGGLQGDYIPGLEGDWNIPAFSRIDPWVDLYFHLVPLPRPYRVRWHGWLVPPQPGVYNISLEARDRAELWLGGELVVRVDDPDSRVYATRELTTAQPIEVLFWDETGYTHVNLRWIRPDGVEETIPTTALQPPPPQVLESGQ